MDLGTEEKAAVYDEVARDPGLLRSVQRLIAKNHPEITVPEVELENQINAAAQKQEQEIAALKTALEEERSKRESADALAKIKASHHLTDAELASVSDTMLKNGITSVETGIKFQRLAAADQARSNPSERLSMKLPPNFAAALKDRRGTRRANLFSAIQDLRTASDHAERLSTL